MADEKITLQDSAPVSITIQGAGAQGLAGEAPQPELVTTTLIPGQAPAMGTVNHWSVPTAMTVTLPETSPAGVTHIVHIDKIQNITWPAGSLVVGTPPVGEAWVTLVKELVGWSILIPSGSSGSGLPVFSPTHPLFVAGSGNGSDIAAFNDFFDTSHSTIASLTPSAISLFRYGASGASGVYAGTVGALWLDNFTKKFRWGVFGEVIAQSGVARLLRSDGTGKITYPLAGQAANSGVTPYIQTSFLAFLAPTDWRNATVSPASVPTAVNAVADLSTWASDSTTPIGACIFVVATNKPAWKSASGVFRDATGTQVFPAV